MFLEAFSDVDIWYSCLLKIVTKLKIIEQGKLAYQSMVGELSVMKILKKDYEKKREIFDFLKWIYNTSLQIKDCANSNELYFERTGNFKKFFEEAVPIGFLALFKYSLGLQVSIQCFTGNQPFDGVISIIEGSYNSECKVEVTTIETNESTMRRQALSRDGMVWLHGPIERNKRKIISDCTATDVIEDENQLVNLAYSRFKSKAEKGYDTDTDILVFLDCPKVPRTEVRNKLLKMTKEYLSDNKSIKNSAYYLYSNNGYIEPVFPPNDILELSESGEIVCHS